MEERQIIKSLKEGDREAFSMLYKQYWEKVYHFCGLYLNNRDVAEDVVQEVFIKVWESREFIREDDNFKGLLFIITRNLIFNHHRKMSAPVIGFFAVKIAITPSYTRCGKSR